jgi:hypothetical protein
MLRACLTLTLVALFACAAFAGHALNSPVATTDPGDFWCSGNADFDGTVVFDGVCTFNADAIFTLDVSVGDDLTVTDNISCDSLYVGSNLAVTDTLTVGGLLKGGRVWLAFTLDTDNIASGAWLRFGSLLMTNARGAVAPTSGWVRRSAVRFNVDTATGGYGLMRVDVNNVRAFADSFDVSEGTGMYTHTLEFAPDAVPVAAGDLITVEYDEVGIIQIDKPVMVLDLQLDE